MDARQKRLKSDEHLLVPTVLIFANFTLCMALYLLYEWHAVATAQNPVLLQRYVFGSMSEANSYAIAHLQWGLLFLLLLLAQVGSLKLRLRLPYLCLMAITLLNFAIWCWF